MGYFVKSFQAVGYCWQPFLDPFPFRGGGGCGVQVQKIPHLGYIYRQLYCAFDVLQKKRWSCRAGEKRIEIDTGGGLVWYLPPLRQAGLGVRFINYPGGLLDGGRL